MDLIASIPAALRVLFAFAVMIVAIRRKSTIGTAFLLGAVVQGLLFGMTPAQLARATFTALTQSKTVALAIIVALILVLSHSMENTGQMQRLLDRFRGLIRSEKLNLVIFPALIGLLPMPGGAIFSAPMVKTLGAHLRLRGHQLSFINYWYRHIWEYWWPLYPGVLLATALANIDLWAFVSTLFPLTLVAVLSGYRALAKITQQLQAEPRAEPPGPESSFLRFGYELLPILMVIVPGLSLGLVLSRMPWPAIQPVAKELGLIVALLLSICWVWTQNRLSPRQRLRIIVQKQLLTMIYMVAAILVFKGILEASSAVKLISDELLHWGIPLVSIIIVLPLLVGSVVGITIAYVGATFPILISLIGASNQDAHLIAYLMLAMTSGFVGVLLSPLHLCLLLSNEYFQTSMGKVYRLLAPACGLVLVAGGCYFWILYRLI